MANRPSKDFVDKQNKRNAKENPLLWLSQAHDHENYLPEFFRPFEISKLTLFKTQSYSNPSKPQAFQSQSAVNFRRLPFWERLT